MKKLLSIAVFGLLLASSYAQAKDDKNMEEKMQKGGKQQEKMKHCNAEAKGMKGEERKMKMSECLKGQ
jgi:Ni/Co efflux regulator RcnB